MLVYADNANYLGVSREQVDAEQKKMRDALHCPGLETHDAQQGASTNLCEGLGVRIDAL